MYDVSVYYYTHVVQLTSTAIRASGSERHLKLAEDIAAMKVTMGNGREGNHTHCVLTTPSLSLPPAVWLLCSH